MLGWIIFLAIVIVAIILYVKTKEGDWFYLVLAGAFAGCAIWALVTEANREVTFESYDLVQSAIIETMPEKEVKLFIVQDPNVDKAIIYEREYERSIKKDILWLGVDNFTRIEVHLPLE